MNEQLLLTHDQFHVLAHFLQAEASLSAAAYEVLVERRPLAVIADLHNVKPNQLQRVTRQFIDAALRIRGAFICHTPGCWEVVVGHHDFHRAPGRIVLKVGDTLRLVCAQVCVMVPVRVTAMPETPQGYYRGVILDIEHTSMRYRPGDGVMFSDDQAILHAGVRTPRRPVPI